MPDHVDPPPGDDAFALAGRIRSGTLTAAACVGAHLDRIRARNPALRALTVVFDERARRAAERVDRMLAQGADPGVLAGVPFSVKENIDLTWSATTEGWRGLAHAVPAHDATVVRRLRQAGAIPVGRGNMPDFGMRWDTDNELFGRTRNPWHPDRTPFGSSGGDAVAVATGMSALGLGNDFGGSIRLPASAAGVCGLRPSAGRVPRAAVRQDPVALTLQRFSVNGILARSVDDLARTLAVVAGVDPADPVSIDLPPVADWDGPRQVLVVRDPLGWGVDPEVGQAVDHAADALRRAGWVVQDGQVPLLEEAATLWRRLACTDMLMSLAPDLLPEPLGRSAAAFLRDSTVAAVPFETAADYAAAWARRAVVEAAWRGLQVETPVVLGPVFCRRTPVIDFDLGGKAPADEAWRNLRLTVAVNFLGLPAVSVPVGRDRDGVPVGVQLIGPAHGEAAALAAAADVERGVDRLPDL